MKSVREITTYKWIIKKSEFICTLIPCNDETAIDNIIKEYQEKYHDATHNCIAYIVGTQKRANDNGEPSGTAGLPMLDVLEKNKLTNIIAIVTRYFGGILLGTGGLTRAYTKGASIALKAGGVVEKVEGVNISLHLDYDMIGKVQYFCGQNNWHIEDTEYTDKVIVHILAEVTVADEIEKEAIEASNGKITVEKSEEGIYFKEDNRLYKIL